MEALTTWRCSVCGVGNQSSTACSMCETARANNESSGAFRIMNQGSDHRGHVFNIHAPTQFNHQPQDPEPVVYSPSPISAPPAEDRVKRFFARGMYAMGFSILVGSLIFVAMTILFFAFIFYKAYVAGIA